MIFTRFARPGCVLACALLLSAAAVRPALAAPAPEWPFFVMDNCYRDTPAHKAGAFLASCGVAAYADRIANVADVRPVMKSHGLDVRGVYTVLDFSHDKPSLTPELRGRIDALANSGATLWVTVNKVDLASGRIRPSDTTADAFAFGRLREIIVHARERGVATVLYPHAGFWLARLDDCLRMSDRLEGLAVGVTFNLCHWLKVEGDVDPEPTLRRALPRLRLVTINGADGGDTRKMDWTRLIQTLDQGSYDVAGLLRTLRRIGYRGPIGLQGYGLKGDPLDNTRRSIEAWKRLTARLDDASKVSP